MFGIILTYFQMTYFYNASAQLNNSLIFCTIFWKVLTLFVNRTFRSPVDTNLRLAVYLRCCASGDSADILSDIFKIGISTVRGILKEVSEAVISCMPAPSFGDHDELVSRFNGTATIDPPTIDPPTIDPPTIDPPKIDPPKIDPPTIDPPTIDPLCNYTGVNCREI